MFVVSRAPEQCLPEEWVFSESLLNERMNSGKLFSVENSVHIQKQTGKQFRSENVYISCLNL